MLRYQQLAVFRSSEDLCESVYDLTAGFPKSEQYGLTSQIRRAVVSIASNIAEGSGRGSDREFARFLTISRGSAAELHAQLGIAVRLGYLTTEQVQPIQNEVEGLRVAIGRMVSYLTR